MHISNACIYKKNYCYINPTYHFLKVQGNLNMKKILQLSSSHLKLIYRGLFVAKVQN